MVPPLQVRVDQSVIAIKEYSILLRVSKQESHPQIHFYYLDIPQRGSFTPLRRYSQCILSATLIYGTKLVCTFTISYI